MDTTLKQMGMTDSQVEVYSLIVQFGYRTKGQIQCYYNEPLENIESTLQELASKGYIKEIKAKNKEGTSYYIPLPPQIKLTEDVSKRLEEELNTTSKSVITDWKETMGVLRTKLEDTNTQITTKADTHVSEVSSLSKQLLTDLNDVVTSNKKELESIVNKINAEGTKIYKTHDEVVKKSIKRIDDNINTSFQTAVTKIGDYHTNFKTKINETYTSLEETHKTRVQKELEDTKSALSELVTLIGDLKGQFESNVEKHNGIVSELTSTTYNELLRHSSKLGVEATNQAKITIEKINDEYKVQVNGYLEKVKEILTSLNTELSTIQTDTNNRIVDTIEKSKKTAIKMLKESESSFLELVDETKGMAVDKLGDIITQTKTHSVGMKDELSKRLNSYLTEFSNNGKKLLQMLNEGLTKGIKQFEDGLTKSVTGITTNINNLNTELETFIDNYITEIFTNIDNLNTNIVDNLDKGLKKHDNLLVEKVKTIQSKVTETEKQFQSEIKTNITSVNEMITQTNNQAKTIENNTLSAIKEEITAKQNEILSSLKTSSDAFKEQTLVEIKKLEESTSNYLADVDDITTTFATEYSTFEENFAETLNGLKGSVTEGINENIQSNIADISKYLLKSEVETKDRIEQFTERFLGDVRRIRDEIPERVNINFQTNLETINELENKIKVFSSNATEIARAVSQFVDTDAKQMKKLLGVKDDADAVAFCENLAQFERELEEIDRQITDKVEEVRMEFSRTFEVITEEVERKMSTNQNEIEHFKGETVTNNEKYYNGKRKEIEEQFNGNYNTMKEKIEEIYQNYQLQHKELQDTFTTKISELFGKDKDSITNFNKIFKDTNTKQMEEVENISKTFKISPFFEKMIKDTQDSVSSFTKEVYSLISAEVEEKPAKKGAAKASPKSAGSIGGKLQDFEAKMNTIITDAIKALNDSNSEMQKTGSSVLKDVIKTTEKEIQQNITASKTQTEEMVSQKKIEMNTQVQSGVDALDKEKTTIFTSVKKSNDDVSNNIKNTIETNIASHTKLVENLTNSMDKTMETLQIQLDVAKNALDTDITTTLEEATTGLKELTTKVEKEVSTSIDKEIKEFSEKAQATTSEISVGPEKSSLLETATKTSLIDLQKLVESYPKQFEAEHKAFAQKSEELITTTKTKAQENVNEVVKIVEKDLATIYVQTTDKIDKHKLKLDETFEKNLKDYELNIKHQINNTITAEDSNSSALITNVQTVKESLTDTVNSTQKTVTTDLLAIEKMTHDLFNTYMKEVINGMDKIVKDSLVNETNKAEYTKALTTFKQVFITESREDVDKLDKKVTDTLNAIPAKIQGVLDATSDSMKLMKTVLSAGSGVEPKAIEDSWIVVGQEEIDKTLMGMLRETKSSVSLVAPHLAWVDVSYLDSIVRQKLDIVTLREGELNDAAVRGKIDEMGNAKIRYGTEIKGFLGIRDGIEEALIGHKTASGQPMMIVTYNEEMVKEIQKIFAEYSRMARG